MRARGAAIIIVAISRTDVIRVVVTTFREPTLRSYMSTDTHRTEHMVRLGTLQPFLRVHWRTHTHAAI